MELVDSKLDNIIEYWIVFPDEIQNDKFNYENKVADCLSIVATDVQGYIWQMEPFCVYPGWKMSSNGKDELQSPYLYGRTDYGDNVSDLWFITYLLVKLTREMEGCVVKVRDSDGEYLLIEAADDLPKWLNPESAVNRVYLFRGEIHILPRDFPDKKSVPKIDGAMQFLMESHSSTRAPDEIQKTVMKRVNVYPEKARKDVHCTTCYLPVKAAQLLAQSPQLVSDAVSSFYTRDALDLRLCQPMKTFTPENRVSTKVKMTKCLYAQLSQQNFHPPKKSSWNIPTSNDPKFKSHDLGMKLAYGFEILVTNCKSRTSQKSPSEFNENDARWTRYVQSLDKIGYFQNEIEGSVKYMALMEQAKQFFLSSSEFSPEDDSRRSDKGLQILEELKALKVSEKELRDQEKALTPDDDDSWLYMTYEELDEILEEYSGARPDHDFNPSSLVDGMNSFIANQSNLLSGVEVPDSSVKYNDKGFLAALEKMINGGSDVDSDDDSSLDEYETDDSQGEAANLIRKSSEKQPASSKPKTTKKTTKVQFQAGSCQGSHAEPEIEDFMEMMDKELSKTPLSKSFERTPTTSYEKKTPTVQTNGKKKAALADVEELTDSDDDIPPVNVDFNTVKNLLESYSQQMGLPGPASSLLGSMGINMPPNSD